MTKPYSIFFGLLLLLLSIPTASAHTPPSSAKVFFIGLTDGNNVKSPLKLKFGITGFGITPAGTKGKIRHTSGHHHLLIDRPELPDLDSPIPNDAHHIHFDKGETETLLELSPGQHTLQLLLGDEAHEPQDPALFSKKITIIVE